MRAWPTLVLIDPAGYVVGAVAGEGHGAALQKLIEELIAEHREAGTLREGPGPLAAPDEADGKILSYPGKIVLDSLSGRLAIADSGHHRILLVDPAGTIRAVAGSGKLGATDGPFGEAAFRHPQGLAFHQGHLYVADTENHLIRRLDLSAGRVETLAGTGRQRHGSIRPAPEGPLATDLNSPWDLAVQNDVLYIAMAGCHQVWALDLAERKLDLVCGTGREALADGPRLEASMNQPSGLAIDGSVLYVADSEASAIRSIDVRPGGQIRTLIGVGLFEFGDRDGSGQAVRLQHPLGITVLDGRIYIADTYNHKIKVLYPSLRRVESVFGIGRPGLDERMRPQFFEPGGLAAASAHLYIADTNNHRICAADLATETVTTLALRPPGP